MVLTDTGGEAYAPPMTTNTTTLIDLTPHAERIRATRERIAEHLATAATADPISTAAITARDFDRFGTRGQNWNAWTRGALDLVIEALGRTPVIVVTDVQTGHAPFNVTLEGTRSGWSGSTEVLVRYPGGHGTWRLVQNIGAIIPLVATQAKWDALALGSELSTYALYAAQNALDGSTWWAKWKVSPQTGDTWFVSAEEATPGNQHMRSAEDLARHGYTPVPRYGAYTEVAVPRADGT